MATNRLIKSGLAKSGIDVVVPDASLAQRAQKLYERMLELSRLSLHRNIDDRVRLLGKRTRLHFCSA